MLQGAAWLSGHKGASRYERQWQRAGFKAFADIENE